MTDGHLFICSFVLSLSQTDGQTEIPPSILWDIAPFESTAQKPREPLTILCILVTGSFFLHALPPHASQLALPGGARAPQLAPTLPASSGTLPAHSRALSAGSIAHSASSGALTAGSETLPAGLKALSAGNAALSPSSKALQASSEHHPAGSEPLPAGWEPLPTGYEFR